MNSTPRVSKSTSAIGVSFTALNASLREECNFLVLHAGSIAHLSSELELCMQRATPAKSVFVMNSAAQIMFCAAALLPLSELRCAPTKITGVGHFCRGAAKF